MKLGGWRRGLYIVGNISFRAEGGEVAELLPGFGEAVVEHLEQVFGAGVQVGLVE